MSSVSRSLTSRDSHHIVMNADTTRTDRLCTAQITALSREAVCCLCEEPSWQAGQSGLTEYMLIVRRFKSDMLAGLSTTASPPCSLSTSALVAGGRCLPPLSH